MKDGYTKKSKDELKKILTDEKYYVTQENGTESPYSNEYDDLYLFLRID